MKQAVVFDFDYTLGDSSRGIIASVNDALRRLGYAQAGDEAVKKTIGLSLAKTFEVLTGTTKDSALFEQYFLQKADEVMVAETTLYDGVEAMLTALHEQGVRLAIVTTKHHRRIEGILEVHHISHLIDEIVGGDDVKNPKPDPEGMRLLADRLGLGMEEMLYVGDSVVDAETADAAGVDFVAVLTGTTDAEAFSKWNCKRILERADQLLEA